MKKKMRESANGTDSNTVLVTRSTRNFWFGLAERMNTKVLLNLRLSNRSQRNFYNKNKTLLFTKT